MTRIHVIATGGTISGTAGPDGAISPSLSGAEIVAAAAARRGADVTVEDLMATDSSALTFRDMDAIVAAVRAALAKPAIDAVLVLHGTDTIEETALLADLSHTDPRPVVFVGALRAADHPESDGAANVDSAICSVVSGSLVGRGVHIVTGAEPRPALGARKMHTAELDAFAHTPLPRQALPFHPIASVRIDIVALYPGADRVGIDAFASAGSDGIVLEAMGSGNSNPEIVAAVLDHAPRIPIVLSTRVPDGPVVPAYGGGGGGRELVAAGAIVSPLLRPGQARIALAALAAARTDRSGVRSWFAAHAEAAR